MNRFVSTSMALALAVLTPVAPVMAQQSSYTPGSVWQFSSIKVLPGQFETYLDYLGGNWRKQLEFAKKEGYVVPYHVLAVNNARKDEPDLILAVEYKDYLTIAQQLASQAKFEAMMASDTHKIEAAAATREPMRTQVGSMQLQELKLK